MYTIKLEKFQGPFDLLLQLIEKEKMDITEISLFRVTDEFLEYLKQVEKIKPDELADFLEVAARLILIKSRLLVPESNAEEDESDDLVNQLKIYQQYARATKELGKIASQPKYLFSRNKIPLDIIPEFSVDIRITPAILEKYFKNFFNILVAQLKLTQKTFKREIISLRMRINELLSLLDKEQKIFFNHLIEKKEKSEKVGFFLAILELVKRKKAEVSQVGLFKEIILKKK